MTRNDVAELARFLKATAGDFDSEVIRMRMAAIKQDSTATTYAISIPAGARVCVLLHELASLLESQV